MNIKKLTVLCYLLGCFILSLQTLATVGKLEHGLGRSLQLESEAALDRGAEFLLADQMQNGSLNDHPAITSLAVMALANLPENSGVEVESAIEEALDYLKRQLREEGGIWNEKTEAYKLYSTAIAVMALLRCNRPEDLAAIGKVRNYLVDAQKSSEGVDDDVFAGGFASGATVKPNLTVTQWVVEALYLIDSLRLPEDLLSPAYREKKGSPRYQAAVEFIERCQLPADEREGMEEDYGCFRDIPVSAGEGVEGNAFSSTPRSEVFLTCLGLKSLRYAGYSLDNERIQGALRCLRKNYSVQENPGLGDKGYYTYLYAFVTAMRSLNSPSLEVDGRKRFWRAEAARELLNRQKGNGGWRQDTPDWRENNPALATAYAMLTLERCLLP